MNFIVGVVAARALGVTEFGAFSIAFLLFTVAWGGYRALLVEPAIILFRSTPEKQVLDLQIPLLLMTLCLTAPIFLVGWIGSSMFQGQLATALKAFSLILPLIISLDILRGTYHAARSPISAERVSGLWLLLVLLSYAFIDLTDNNGLYMLVLPFGLLAGLIVLLSVRWFDQNIFVLRRKTPIRAILSTGWPLFLEFLVVGISVHLLGLLLGVFYGLEQAGAFRGALIIVGPMITMMGSARIAVLSDATKYRASCGDGSWVNYLLKVTSVGFAMCALFGITLVWISYSYGQHILGDTWENAKSVVLPTTLLVFCSVIHITTGAVLRARELGHISLMVRVKQLPIVLIFSLIGMFISAASGAAWGLFFGTLVSIPFWIYAAVSVGASSGGTTEFKT